jgi:lysophospholipase L1-like esterase
VLRRDEWAWWPLAPVLAWQGLRAARRVPRLPPAPGPSGRVGAGAAAFRLLGLGDSTIAGVGCTTQAEALTGATAARLAARDGRTVEWVARGVSGATAADVRRALLPAALEGSPDAVILSVGVNDVVRGRSPASFAADLVAIVAAFDGRSPAVKVVYAGLPPLGSFPALAPPLASLLDRRARRLAAAAEGALAGRATVVRFPPRLPPSTFAGDGFHPGAAGCAVWADWVAAALAAPGPSPTT